MNRVIASIRKAWSPNRPYSGQGVPERTSSTVPDMYSATTSTDRSASSRRRDLHQHQQTPSATASTTATPFSSAGTNGVIGAAPTPAELNRHNAAHPRPEHTSVTTPDPVRIRRAGGKDSGGHVPGVYYRADEALD